MFRYTKGISQRTGSALGRVRASSDYGYAYAQLNPYPAGVYGELLIMPTDGRWDLTRCLKG